MRGRVEHSGPTTAAEIGEFLDLPTDTVQRIARSAGRPRRRAARQLYRQRRIRQRHRQRRLEWCDRRLLARIHRLTLAGLREQIQPVEPRRVLAVSRAASSPERPTINGAGQSGVREAIAQLQGFELPAGAWEQRVLAARIADYDPALARSLVSVGRGGVGPA